MFTFFDRMPQKPLREIFHFDPAVTSRERFPEKIPNKFKQESDQNKLRDNLGQ